MLREQEARMVADTYHANRRIRERATRKLMDKHNKLLLSEANRAFRNDPRSHGTYDLDDYIQEARIVALESYGRFDPAKANGLSKRKAAKISTYVCDSVRLNLREYKDQLAHIRCTAQNKKWKTYFSGGYENNPAKKRQFEADNNLDDVQVFEEKRRTYRGLFAKVSSLDEMYDQGDGEYSLADLISDPTAASEEQILDRLLLEEELAKWPTDLANIFWLRHIEGYQLKEIAAKLGCKEHTISNKLETIAQRLAKFGKRISGE